MPSKKKKQQSPHSKGSKKKKQTGKQRNSNSKSSKKEKRDEQDESSEQGKGQQEGNEEQPHSKSAKKKNRKQRLREKKKSTHEGSESNREGTEQQQSDSGRSDSKQPRETQQQIRSEHSTDKKQGQKEQQPAASRQQSSEVNSTNVPTSQASGQSSSYSDASQRGPYHRDSPEKTYPPNYLKKVDFHLYVEGSQVDEAYIQFSFREKPVPLHPAKSSSPVQLWRRTWEFKYPPSQRNPVSYSYAISARSSATAPQILREAHKRTIESPAHHDVFRFINDANYTNATVPQGILFYTRWFFQSVNGKSIKWILFQIDKMKFSFLDPKYVLQCLQWILEKAVDRSISDEQGIYLCAILGHLANNHQTQPLPLGSEEKTRNAFDRLLRCLANCANPASLSFSIRPLLEKMAPVLVQNSSSPGWLTLAAHFYPYLGVNFVTHHQITAGNYEKQEYRRMVDLLVSRLACTQHDSHGIHQKLLRRVLQNAPDQYAVFELFDGAVNKFFAREADKLNFFANFHQNNYLDKSGKRADSSTKLSELMRIPELLRCQRMSGVVFSSLFEFAKSVDEPQQDDVEAFPQLFSSTNLLPNSVENILEQLSRSQSTPRHNLLPQLLSKKIFELVWKKVHRSKKVNICNSWITTKLANEAKTHRSVGTTTVVYQALEDLLSRPLIVSTHNLAEDLKEEVSQWLSEKEDASSILKASKDIEKCSSVIQECYLNLVKRILKRNPQLFRRSSEILRQSSSLSFGKNLLFCLLDVLEIPVREGNDREGVFKMMLESCDLWIILFREKENIKVHKTFRAGEKIWHELQTCITKGEISVNFMEDVRKYKDELSAVCAAACAGSNTDNNELRQKFSNRISELVKLERSYHENLSLLESAIKFERKVLEDSRLDRRSEITNEFNERKHNLRTMQLRELDDKFWGPLFPLLGLARTLKPLMESVSFINVARVCLEEEYKSKSASAERGGQTSNELYSLFEVLTSKGIESFRVKWFPVLNNPDFQTMGTMKTLLGNLKDEAKLEREFSILEQYFRKRIAQDLKHYMEDYVKYPKVLMRVNHVCGFLDTFGLDGSKNRSVSSLTTFKERFQNRESIFLRALHEPMAEVQEFLSQYIDETDGVMEELGRSSELHSFLEEIVDEDIRFLIDAVEEHSDQFVSESLVSELIDVHGFLGPLIKMCQNGFSPELILMQAVNLSRKNKGVAMKIQQCSTYVNSLKGLYTSVANRGELTKEIIANCLKKGEYTVCLRRDGSCEAKISYMDEKNTNGNSTTHFLSDLHDLRSRAHLIVSSDKNMQKPAPENGKEDQDINFADFIEQVNLLTEITELLSKLRSSGYVKYRSGHWQNTKGTENLQNMKDNLQRELEVWENSLSKARQKYYFLNYFRSDQLCVLHDFFISRCQVEAEDVLSLIHFVDPGIKKYRLEEYQKMYPMNKQTESVDNPDEMVSIIGEALEEIFGSTSPVVRPIADDQATWSSVSTTSDATVKPGELFVASLEEDSPLTANVMLTLYENTSNAFPEPHQIVFCDPKTAWEEIHLVLQRCFLPAKYLKRDNLFCIANVEQLANEVQFKLVNVIKMKQNSVCEPGSSKEENEDYRLALICRGGGHHHIVEEFAQYSHHIASMTSYQALSQHLKSHWPEVKIVTSALPGLGKTETVRREALEKKMNAVTFPISGPLDQSKLIQRLKQLNLKEYHCLHLDISEVDDPLLLDTFLFQLIVTGMISSGTQLYHLQTAHVYIEIANTLKDWLLESLLISKCFTRIHIKWRDYEDLLISSKITSNIQVVCQYFDVRDRRRLESTDVHFAGQRKVRPLPATRCRELLAKYYSSKTDTTFTTLNTFLGVLASQLRKFSKSAYFKIDNLESMLGSGAHGVRTNLFNALLDVSKEFASRSVITCSSSNVSQTESAQALDKAVSSSGMSARHMVERVEGMIQWEQSNHLLVVFHGANSQTIAAVYRDKDLVPPKVKDLLTSQVVKRKDKELEDFRIMSQEELQEKLERIACTKPSKKSQESLFSRYALTPDNILKMILIILRVRANAPVIIMGETGCGKTSLVRYLANICQVEFFPFNFHAGITEDDVKEFIQEMESQARESREQIWVFLDEINTCDHLGMISDIMCHHTLFGRPLSKYLVFFAACNPYKLRPEDHITTAGLEAENTTDEYSGLVYRVHPLPEAMIDYVWDYGSLAPKDEKAYIQRMVKQTDVPEKYIVTLVNVLAGSQEFIRDAEKNHFCVSLRDVYRCINLVKWFRSKLEERTKVEKSTKQPRDLRHLQKYRCIAEKYDQNHEVKSIVLALAHCYLSRLPTAELRSRYRERMMILFSGSGTMMRRYGEVDSFSAIVRMEEEDYLDRMELPSGTARNAALRENVFVMLVSILNRIPVFVVGKPGCSKSLSMQLIRTNLRGRDSKDRFFRKLPQLYVVSYQGSESSTSEGIIKVFEKARKYKEHNKDGNVLPVVLLDEVGLAENSKNNPLKVLHNLLEPGDGELPEVAVVGISNWALDAAKMNRAIHLSRPEPTIEDLYETGHSLHYADSTNRDDYDQRIGEKELGCLAEAYFEYQSRQTRANFHGLRDYYSLIKSLSSSSDLHQINVALQRNFGGIPGEMSTVQKIFLDKLKNCMISSGKDTTIPVINLIQENLVDQRGRHLMLITSGDSAIGILKHSLAQLKKEIITIFGSSFEEDVSEDYNYRILSRIILYMERDCILILRDLESIYGSLYDMLNQNYSVVGKRRNCRVALGAHSNPMCHVNDGFRCIVLTDHQKVDFSDPPFLNRFEKQLLRFSDVLNKRQLEIIQELDRWVCQISTVPGFESQFTASDMFAGFHDDTLPSLVHLHSHDTDELDKEIIQKCKDDLMWVATPDGVLRTQKCDHIKEDPDEVKILGNAYFEKPIHNGLASFMKTVMSNQEAAFFSGDEIGTKTIVMTYSTIHTDVLKCLSDTVPCQTERLSAYKSEKQLAVKVENFWSISEKELLVLQCKPELDSEHMLLARSIIENKRSAYKKACEETGHVRQRKHVCIVVHLQRGTAPNTVPWQFNFLCGWKQVFLDVLEDPPVPLTRIRTESVHKLLTSIWPLRKFVQDYLLWCFNCIRYTQNQRTSESIFNIVENFLRPEKVYHAIEQLILQCVNENGFEELEERSIADEPWQVKVACDRQALINSSTLLLAMEQYVSHLVRQPLTKIIYFLEKENAWPPHVVQLSQDSNPEYEDMWCTCIANEAFFKMSEIPTRVGAGSYILDSVCLDLHLPFSNVIMRKVDSAKDLVLEDYNRVVDNQSNLDENGRLKPDVQLQQIKRYSEMILNLVPQLHEIPQSCCSSYMDDLFDVMSADFSSKMNRSQRVSIVKCAYLSYAKQGLRIKNVLHFYAQIHLFAWLSEDKVLDQLRMVDCCQQFVLPQVVKDLTDEFLGSQDILAELEYGDLNDGSNTPIQDVEMPAENPTRIYTEIEQYGLEDEGRTPQSPEQEGYVNENNGTIFDNLEVETELSDDESTETLEEGEGDHDTEDATESSEESESDDGSSETSGSEISEDEITDGHSEDESDASSESDEEEHEEQECFEDILVTTFCEQMLPSQETVEERNGGVNSWIRNATLLLSTAFGISNVQTPAFHFLRLCVDYAKMVLVPSKQPSFSLYILEVIGSELQPGYLEEDESFQKITEYLIEPLEELLKDEKDKYEVLLKFSALFYGRSIDTNADTSGARSIVKHVFSLNRADFVLVMGPVVYRMLLVEETYSPGIFVDIITKPRKIISNKDRFPCLHNIDQVFKDLFDQGLIHHDSYAAVLVCDLIQSILNFDEHYRIDDLNSSDCKLLQCARGAIRVLSGNEQDNRGLVLLSSVAFLRAFFRMLSSFIAKQPNVLKVDTSYSHVMGEISSFLCSSSARQFSLEIFFLKQLNQTDVSFFELRKLCLESEMLPAVKSVFQQNTQVAKAKFVSMHEPPEYHEAQTAYRMLTQDDQQHMVTFITRCPNSPNRCLGLMRILVNRIYLKRAVRNPTDKEERLAEWFSQKFDRFPLPLKELLSRIIGRKEFNHTQMRLSPESSADEVQTALLILHISCVLASGVQGGKSPLYQYFTDPLKCKQTYILAHGDDRIKGAFAKREPSHGTLFITCSCGLRIMFKNDRAGKMCPHCHTVHDSFHSENNEKTSSNAPTFSMGYSRDPAQKSLKWDSSTAEMHPSVFRALHLIVYASFYAGVATGITSKDSLASLLDLKEDQSSHVAKRCHDPAEFCFNQIKTDLEYLRTILCCKKEMAVNVMHLVVEKSAELIRGVSLKNTCSTPEQRLEWEVEFTNIAKNVLPEALGSARAVKEIARITTKDNQATSSIEEQIHELDAYPTEPKHQNQQLKRLFRATRQPSFEEFRSTFLNTSKDFQEKHSFLSLFFAKFDDLRKIGYLHHLLEWTRLVSSALTHRISREEAQLISINDFICGHFLGQDKTQDEKETQRELFNNFKEAWNNMGEFVNEKLSQEDEMPRLTQTGRISYCLMESDVGIFLRTAINILVSLQNTILDDILFLSAQEHHPALNFLEKSDSYSGVSSVSLQEAKEKEIINFSWSDNIFKYAQNSLEYGQGEDINYDFERIEIELANDVAFGKCHLAGSLNKFLFSNELFHYSSAMLTEFRELFHQSANLPDDVRQGLVSLKDYRINDAQSLLQHVEVLIFLLKLKLKDVDVEMTLETFVGLWLMMLPSPFPVLLLPEPRGSIKLKHVAALYEALEDLLADGAIEGLPKRYRQDLTDETKKALSCLVDNRKGEIRLQLFLNALRRFVFRYLSSGNFQQGLNTPLSSCLDESSLWSPDPPPDLQVISSEMALEHIHSVIIHLQELDKERKELLSQGRPYKQRRLQDASKKSSKKRRVVATFSRF